VIGKKTAIGDKAVTRRSTVGISWDRLPFATKPMVTLEDISEQRETVSVELIPAGHLDLTEVI
jgi:cohesin loading factor subunit SCC2